MKIHARQHLPNFVDIDRQPSVEVSSLEELLAVPWIASWATDSTTPLYRWSQSSDHDRLLLMAEYKNGDEFYVVAYLTSDEPLSLPEWHETETARLRREKWNRGETS